MDILAPWSLSGYLPLNGFHPLYRSLADLRLGDARIVVPKIPGYDEFLKLLEYAVYRNNFSPPPPDWVGGPGGRRMFRAFAEAHGKADLWLQSNLSGDVELLHTAPATRGDRPFLLHCESFLPIFFPFFRQGAGLDEKKVEAVRGFYRNLFESRNCFGIVSHLPETLDQIADFFKSKLIDGKLTGMPIGLDPSYIASGVEKTGETVNFIFMNSAHQNPASFQLRGGVSCLKLALQLLAERGDLMFYFRTARPSDEAMAAFGIDSRTLRRFEGNQIVWIEHYLPDPLLTNLIAKCHFMLLPSANLHSVSIMTAQANGAIPVVTDTIGTDVYVKDMVNGVVLRGVRSEIWKKNAKLRITHDRHALFREMEPALTAALIARLRGLLARPEKIRDMAKAARKNIRQNFDGPAFATRLIEETGKRAAKIPGNALDPQKNCFAKGERWIEDIAPAHFQGPPQPLTRLDLHNGTIYQLRTRFVFIPRERSKESAKNSYWSPLRVVQKDFDPPHFRAIRADSLAACIEATRASFFGPGLGQRMQPIVKHHVARRSFKERVWIRLRPYKVPFAVARKTYHALRRIGVVR